MGFLRVSSYIVLVVCSACVPTESAQLRRNALLTYNNMNLTSTTTEFTTVFVTQTIPFAAISTSKGSSCGGISINAVNVNAYYWDSIHRITETYVERDEACTVDPNAVIGRPIPITPNSTDPSLPATIPIYLSYVESLTSESAYLRTVIEPPLTISNVSYAGLTEVLTQTKGLFSTVSPDPTDMVVTAQIVGNGTLTSATPVIVYSAVEIVSASSDEANHICNYFRATTSLPRQLDDTVNPAVTTGWIQKVRAPVSGEIVPNERNMKYFSQLLNISDFTLGTYEGYPTVAVVSYFFTILECVSPVQALSTEDSLALATSAFPVVPNYPSPSPSPTALPAPQLTSAPILSLPSPVSSPPSLPLPSPNSPVDSPNPSSNLATPSTDRSLAAPSSTSPQKVGPTIVAPAPPKATSIPSFASIIASIFNLPPPSRPSLGRSGPLILPLGPTTLTANSRTAFVLASQTLNPGGSPITVSGTTLRLLPAATAVVINDITSPLVDLVPASVPTTTATATAAVAAALASPPPTLLTLGTQIYTADGHSELVVPAQTILPGGTVTVDGVALNLPSGASGVEIVVGSSIFEEIVVGSTTFEEAIVGSTTFEEIVAGSSTFVEVILPSTTFEGAVFGSTTFQEIVAGSSTFEEVIVGSSTFEEIIAGSTTIGDLVVGSTTFQLGETATSGPTAPTAPTGSVAVFEGAAGSARGRGGVGLGLLGLLAGITWIIWIMGEGTG